MYTIRTLVNYVLPKISKRRFSKSGPSSGISLASNCHETSLLENDP